MAKPYGDIGKDAKDLLNNDFVGEFGGVKATINSKNEGLTMKTSFEVKESSTARIEPKYEISKNLEFSGKIATTKDYTGTLSSKVSDKVKLEVSTTTSEKKGLSASGSVTYTHPQVVSKFSVNAPYSLKGPEAAVEVSCRLVDSFLVGMSGSLNLETKVPRAEAAVSYLGDKNSLAMKGSLDKATKKSIVGASYFHKVRGDLKLGFDSECDFSNKDKIAVGGALAVEYNANSNTAVKGKLKNKGNDVRFGLGVKHKLNPAVTVTVGTDVNVRSLLATAGGAPHNYGVDFKLDL